jgi:protein phosphatase
VIGYDSIEYASLTDVGIRRSHNQDAHAALLAGDVEQWRQRGHIFLVADGMGAHAVGELASELAVSIIPHTYQKHALQEGVPALRKAFVEANATIHAKGQQNPEFGGMGTTTTALLLRPEGAWIGHVGDSRAYRVRGEQIEQMSFDHSLHWEMARRQGVAPEGLRGIPSNVIVRSLGPEPLVQVDLEGPHEVRAGDIFLLCSDGLSGQVSDLEMGAIARLLPPAEACRLLVDLANLGGGPDNITVLIVRINVPAGSTPEDNTDRPPWYRRIPWPLAALVIGVMLAGGAGLLTYYQVSFLNVAAFILAALAILAGLLGLLISYNQEHQRRRSELGDARPHIYRQVRCPLNRLLVEKMAKAVDDLKQQLQEKQWQADWSGHQRHQETAETLLQQGNLAESFREYCRSVRLLTEALQRQRPKGEAFQPVWH